jgi:oligopeptide transport system substrate-binding protein
MAPEGMPIAMHRITNRILQVLSPVLAMLAMLTPWLGMALIGLPLLAAHAAAPGGQAPGEGRKVLRITFQAAETSFDPARISDYYSGTVIEAIFEPLLTYDYLARPARLVPNTAESMPEVSDGGRTWTFRVRRGIHFTPDPAFKGRPRELQARDYAYAIRRFMDPANRSPYAFLFEGRITGLDELAAEAAKSGRFDYDAPVAGLQTPDSHTLRIHLREPDLGFAYVMAHSLAGGIAREVVEAYGAEVGAHPVGTGAFMLSQYTRSSRIVLSANPGYRSERWNFAAGADPQALALDGQIVSAMRGRKVPAIDAVEISIMEETQSRWLAFVSGDTDLEYQLWEVAPRFMNGDGTLKEEFSRRGIRLHRSVDPEIVYLHFNTGDTLGAGGASNPLGGFTPARIALRRAIALAWRIDDQIAIIRKGQSVKATYPIPPGVAGHLPDYRGILRHDPRTANALLDRYGYVRGRDGYRRQPDGSPLVVRFSSMPSERDRQFDELMKRSLDAIGVRVDIHKDHFAELIKQQKQCRLMMRMSSWIADYPDGDNFMQLLYGSNTGQSNSACYRSPEYDALYERSRRLPDGPERDRLYRDMTRLMEVHTAWRITDSRYRNVLTQPRVVGYKTHPVMAAVWKYLDIDAAAGSSRRDAQ